MSDWEDAPSGGWEEAPTKRADPRIGQLEELTRAEQLMSGVTLPGWLDKLIDRGARPVVKGMSDMQVGGGQVLANLLPDSTGIPGAVNKAISDEESRYQQTRGADAGPDYVRGVAQIANPLNILIAKQVGPMASTIKGQAGQGAGFGGLGGLLEPVYDAENGGYWGKKTGQVAGGVVAGALFGPAFGYVSEKATRLLLKPGVSPGAADDAIAVALKDLGQTIHDVPPEQLQALREQVSASLAKGQTLDAGAALRKSDFDALGMPSLAGQITRNPMQFAAEQNLRGVRGVGEPITAVLGEQGEKLQARLPGGAKDAFNAGTQISESLKNTDDVLRKHVSGLYSEARASAGKDLDVPLQGLAQDYARILGDFADNVPSAIRQKFGALGLDPAMPSNQRKVFTLENANELLQVINKNDPRHANPPVSAALGELRAAVKGAVTSADSSGGPFAPAIKAAAERFNLHDAIPALEAASRGSVAPDDFVRRFVINGKTNDVRGLAQVLKQSDPAAYQEARSQIGEELRRAAFGENLAGDAPFAATRYMATVRRIGVDKLSAFFDAKEVSDLLTVGRVGTYIKQAPNAAAVNTSNTAGAVMNLLTRVPGVSGAVGVANRAAGALKDNATVRRAVASEVPSAPTPLSEVQRNYLAYLLSLGGVGLGGLAASAK